MLVAFPINLLLDSKMFPVALVVHTLHHPIPTVDSSGLVRQLMRARRTWAPAPGDPGHSAGGGSYQAGSWLTSCYMLGLSLFLPGEACEIKGRSAATARDQSPLDAVPGTV